MERVEVRNGKVTLVGDVDGPEDGEPVVLLHGGGQTRWAWGGTAEKLSDAGMRTWSMDLRGHGESDWAPDRDYRIEAFVSDLCAVAEAAGGRPHVVGASLGGITGLVTAGEHACEVASLTLVDVGTRIEDEGRERIMTFMTAAPEGFGTLEQAGAAVAAYLPHRPPPSDLSGLAKNLRQGTDGRWRWHWDPAFVMGPLAPRDVSNSTRLDDAARALDMPAMVVRGRLSDILSEEGAQEFLAFAPHARYVDVSDAHHMVAGDRNDVFTGAVLEFLRDAMTTSGCTGTGGSGGEPAQGGNRPRGTAGGPPIRNGVR